MGSVEVEKFLAWLANTRGVAASTPTSKRFRPCCSSTARCSVSTCRGWPKSADRARRGDSRWFCLPTRLLGSSPRSKASIACGRLLLAGSASSFRKQADLRSASYAGCRHRSLCDRFGDFITALATSNYVRSTLRPVIGDVIFWRLNGRNWPISEIQTETLPLPAAACPRCASENIPAKNMRAAPFKSAHSR